MIENSSLEEKKMDTRYTRSPLDKRQKFRVDQINTKCSRDAKSDRFEKSVSSMNSPIDKRVSQIYESHGNNSNSPIETPSVTRNSEFRQQMQNSLSPEPLDS